MSKIFFKIGNTDFSAAVDVQNYSVDDVEVFESWTDANWVEHRNYVRTRLQGRILLGYRNAADFAAAVSAIASAKTANGGYASCTLWVNNTGANDTGDCYLTIVGTGKWDEANGRQWQTLEIDVQER